MPGRSRAASTVIELLLSVAIASIALSASNGIPCVSGTPQIACDFSQPTGVSWVLTGVWALSLALTLAWPGNLQAK